MGWYSKIAKDISSIPNAIDYYETELEDAKKECKIYGNIEKASFQMSGLVEHRFNQLQELEAILEYLNIELRRLRSTFFKKYLENYSNVLYPAETLKNMLTVNKMLSTWKRS